MATTAHAHRQGDDQASEVALGRTDRKTEACGSRAALQLGDCCGSSIAWAVDRLRRRYIPHAAHANPAPPSANVDGSGTGCGPSKKVKRETSLNGEPKVPASESV